METVNNLASKKSFVYFMSVWAVSYAELTNSDLYLPMYDVDNLFNRVSTNEHYPHLPVIALTEVLEEDYPDTNFNYGLGHNDLVGNAKYTQVLCLLEKLRDLLREIDLLIASADRELRYPIMSGVGVVTPVRLGSYLRAHLRYIELINPEFCLGGTNGQLTILKLSTDITNFKIFARKLAKSIQSRLKLDGIKVVTPQPKQAFLPSGFTNEATLFSGISVANCHKGLADTLRDQVTRRILVPSNFDKTLYELNKSIKLFDKSIISLHTSNLTNKIDLEGWVFLFKGLRNLYNVLENSYYCEKQILAEFKKSPENLNELVTYYENVKEGKKSNYSMLNFRENFTIDFHAALRKMVEWEVF